MNNGGLPRGTKFYTYKNISIAEQTRLDGVFGNKKESNIPRVCDCVFI